MDARVTPLRGGPGTTLSVLQQVGINHRRYQSNRTSPHRHDLHRHFDAVAAGGASLANDPAIHLLRKRLDHWVTRRSLSSGRALRGPVERGPVMTVEYVSRQKQNAAAVKVILPTR